MLENLSKHHLYLGTSSWKYEGWKGLVYLYSYPSEKKFNDESLREYAQQYPTVGVDATYYTWPSTKAFEKYLEQTPSEFRFGLKATEKVTVFKYPKLPRYGKEAGTQNAHFLDAELFKAKFLEPLLPFKERIGPIMLEFSHFYPGMLKSGKEFVDRLDTFLKQINQHGNFQFAVEIRNANWLKKEYFECLVENRTAHVFNSWTKMPALGEQLELSQNYNFPCYVARLLLNPGAVYQEAVDSYSPYNKLHLNLSELRTATVRLLHKAKSIGVPAYIFVNNRFEGCAPKTIEALLAEAIKTNLIEG